MKILTAQQMRELDRLTVERVGIPYSTLMETAGARVVEAIIEHYGPVEGKTVLVLCGKGNNGGDGAVVARLLSMRGARVKVSLFGRLSDVPGEARANLEIVKQLVDAGQMIFADDDQAYGPEWANSDERTRPFQHPDFIVDAMFGTGLSRAIEGRIAKFISEINEHKKRHKVQIISIDIPSGLPSDSGLPIGPHMQADLTVTFTAPKIGNLLPPACYANGKLTVACIGTPRYLLEEECDSHIFLVQEKQVAEWLRASRRAPDAHKGSVGDVLLIAGSRGKTGAAALASEAVLRAGAGLVTVATARSAQALLVSQARAEVMTEALDETEGGAIAHEAAARALKLAERRTVIALGPGLSSTEESTRRFVRQVVMQRAAPMVIDADGLNSLAPWAENVRGSAELPLIITPHPGEMARLTGKTTAEVIADGIGVAREFATAYQVITVLKGSRTLIAAPDGEVYVNPTGNAGMATAGSGDVLTGLIAGLIAQRPQAPLEAVIAAVYLHGLAGDIAAKQLGMRALIASDITDRLSAALLRVGGDGERGSAAEG
jgi:hydroxyethylthiazole kinase-like uncharacterized protein yjeF